MAGKESEFWNNVAKYSKSNEDDAFTKEVVYIMVSIHKTGG